MGLFGCFNPLVTESLPLVLLALLLLLLLVAVVVEEDSMAVMTGLKLATAAMANKTVGPQYHQATRIQPTVVDLTSALVVLLLEAALHIIIVIAIKQ
jgi:hypothetical protein